MSEDIHSRQQLLQLRLIRRSRMLFGVASTLLLIISLAATVAPAQAHNNGTHTGNVSVFATGLNNPRGLEFGPDGKLYVAEGGTGGTNSTVGQCTQVVPPIGPYTGGMTARISRINSQGTRTTVVDHLPSDQTSDASGNLVSGVADVTFLNGKLYALLSGAGCSHGNPDVPNGIIRVNANGATTLIANLSAFQQSHPVAHPEADDFEPDGTWYSMVAVRGNLYALEPNHGELDKITPDGHISRVIDISASQGHIVPTALAYHGNFYVGNLNTFPVVAGSSNIYKITPSGNIKVFIRELTTVLGVAFDNQNRMYVLETTTVSGQGPTPGTGAVVRVSRSGALETIASGLTFPSGMTFGPDGKLYVSTFGFGFPPGVGQIVRITVPEK